MFQSFKQKVVKQNKVAGISVQIAPDGSMLYSYTLLEQLKGLIVVTAKGHHITDLSVVKSQISSDWPVVVQIDGKGFLHKPLEGNTVDKSKIVSSIIPNAKDEDFYLQQTEQYISIIRRKVLDDFLKTFTEILALPVSISFGPFALELLMGIISDFPTSIGPYQLKIIDQHIFNFTFTENKETFLIRVDDQDMASDELLSYAVALQFLVKGEAVCEAVDIVTQHASDWNEKLFFKKAGWGVMLFFLVLLLINFVLYTIYDSRYQTLQKQRYGAGNQFALQDNLQTQVQQKESFLQNAGWLAPSKISFEADRLAATVPASIKLTSLIINPVEEIIENEVKKQQFRNGDIVIEGSCTTPEALNTWIKVIDSFDWIDKVKLNNYLYDNRAHEAVFQLGLKVKK